MRQQLAPIEAARARCESASHRTTRGGKRSRDATRDVAFWKYRHHARNLAAWTSSDDGRAPLLRAPNFLRLLRVNPRSGASHGAACAAENENEESEELIEVPEASRFRFFIRPLSLGSARDCNSIAIRLGIRSKSSRRSSNARFPLLESA